MTLPPPAFDHIALAAASREEGVSFIRQTLGVVIPNGGEHVKMGTHNAVARTGGDTYLEILAIDPAAPAPEYPRWFGLDEPETHRQLAHGPKISTWVVRTPDLEASLAAARNAGLELGSPIAMTRGDLSWSIAYRADGALPEGGTLPVLIQWSDGPHPSNRMSDVGLRLVAVTLQHPQPELLARWLEALNARDLVEIDPVPSERPSVHATYDGPSGICRI